MPCDPVPRAGLPVKKHGGGPGGWIEGDPFPVFASVECGPGGEFMAQAQGIARARLEAGEQCAVEKHVWGVLQAEGGRSIGTPDLARPLLHALGEMDAWLARERGGVGVIHVPAELVGFLSGPSPLVWDAARGRVRTRLGSSVVFGACYDMRQRPDGKDAKPGEATVFVSGPLVVRRSPVQSYDGLDRVTNDAAGVAERVYAVAVDCPAAWMTVKVSCAC
ncbi:hypothetical protein ACIPRL_07835 [Streptomyces sp. NPDC090085]|uniref:hypothetical protein n=1 Tax=Streptomyces sp. NPDC090085 TaxID=3365943 RepID=UPI00380901D3